MPRPAAKTASPSRSKASAAPARLIHLDDVAALQRLNAAEREATLRLVAKGAMFIVGLVVATGLALGLVPPTPFTSGLALTLVAPVAGPLGWQLIRQQLTRNEDEQR